jgi:ATP adenylyltransferase
MWINWPFQEKAEVRKICEERLQSFIARRGLGIWDYRMLEDDPVPDSVRYQVLKESGGKCSLCGATSKDAVLQVEHIVPRTRGGTNNRANLQVLCHRCNGGKGNKDDTDFRSWRSETTKEA